MGSGQAKMLIICAIMLKTLAGYRPNIDVFGAKKADIIITHGKSKETLHCRTHLAHYASMPQEGIPVKFSKDRRRYLQWLWEAKKRYGLVILNYIVTSNHIHLLVADDGDRMSILRSIQLVAARTGQE